MTIHLKERVQSTTWNNLKTFLISENYIILGLDSAAQHFEFSSVISHNPLSDSLFDIAAFHTISVPPSVRHSEDVHRNEEGRETRRVEGEAEKTLLTCKNSDLNEICGVEVMQDLRELILSEKEAEELIETEEQEMSIVDELEQKFIIDMTHSSNKLKAIFFYAPSTKHDPMRSHYRIRIPSSLTTNPYFYENNPSYNILALFTPLAAFLELVSGLPSRCYKDPAQSVDCRAAKEKHIGGFSFVEGF
ncbi:hypothetical protein Aperf_G00000060209 [Anoplocephala perfoliata]